MLITNISPQKRKKNWVNIFVDGKFSFSLDLETLAKNHLSVNQEISQEKIEKLIKEGTFIKFYDRVTRFLYLRPRSEKEIIDYLRKKQAGEKEILMIVNKLKKIELINDSKFASWWYEQRETFKPRGQRIIKMELLKKGVDKKIIDEIGEKKENSDIEMARKIAQKVLRRYKILPREDFYRKMSNFLVQRGFEWDTVKDIMKEIMTEMIK